MNDNQPKADTSEPVRYFNCPDPDKYLETSSPLEGNVYADKDEAVGGCMNPEFKTYAIVDIQKFAALTRELEEAKRKSLLDFAKHLNEMRLLLGRPGLMTESDLVNDFLARHQKGAEG